MIPPLITFDVLEETPRPQGSHDPKGGRVSHSSPGLALWRQLVATAARQAYLGKGTLDEPVVVEMTFYLNAPRRPRFEVPTEPPDGDKLDRAILDALVQGRVLRDDALVTTHTTRKFYAHARQPEGVHVEVWRWRDLDETLSALTGAAS